MARLAKKPVPKKAVKAAPKKAIPAKAAKAVVAKPAPKTAAKATTKPAPAKAVPSPKAVTPKVAAPKAVPAAVAPPAPPPRKRKPAFTPAELEQIRTDLEAQRAVFARELAELEAGTFNQSQSDLSGEVSFDEESADAGTFTFERERDLSLSSIRSTRRSVASGTEATDRASVAASRSTRRGSKRCRIRFFASTARSSRSGSASAGPAPPR